MCKFIGKSNERILCKLNKSEILKLYSIVHVAMETTKTSNFTCQSKSFIIIFFTCQVSACELQPFSCHDLANDIYSQTAKTVYSHLYAEDVCGQYKVNYPHKTAEISRCHYWFTHKMTSEKRAQEIPYWWPVTTQIWLLLLIGLSKFSTNQAVTSLR